MSYVGDLSNPYSPHYARALEYQSRRKDITHREKMIFADNGNMGTWAEIQENRVKKAFYNHDWDRLKESSFDITQF